MMADMNSLSLLSHRPPPPAVFAMLSHSSRLLLAETSNAITITLKRVEGYAHYGIND